MSDQNPKPRGNPAWQRGAPSPNPRGRPRTGLAFAERVRERVDPDLVIDLALRVAADEETPPAERLAVLLPLIDRGFIKPPTTIAARVETTTSPRAFDHLSDAELELEIARCRALLTSPQRLVEPMSLVEEMPTDHRLPTDEDE